MNKVQRFFRTHYTGIMLAIIVLSVAGSLVMLALLGVSQTQQVQKANEQIQLLKTLAGEISQDQQKQHDHQDERQACFFNLFVTYTGKTPREPITKEEADKCRVLNEDGVEVTTSQQTAEQQVSEPQTTQPEAQPDTERQDNPNKPENPGRSEERSLLDTMMENVADLFRGVR